MKREKPIFAETFFFVKEDRIYQSLYFFYYDESKIYHNLMETGAIEGELDSISKKLQGFIDEDDLHINGNLVKMNITKSNIFFQDKKPMYPVLQFNVSSTPYKLHQDIINEIHLYAKPEIIPYSAYSSWNISGKIIRVESKSFFRISTKNDNVIFFLTKGEVIGDDERIFFQLNFSEPTNL